MKTTILYGLLLFSMVASLCGCTADELPASSEASGDVESFSITVADAGGYASVSGGTPTRATENGYTTTFVEGDQIGVFAVKNNALMPRVNNLRLTAKNDGGRLVWLDDYGKSPLRYTGATYYAYYPYRDGIEGTPNNTNQDATSFFANVIKGWTPSTNQGSSTAYSAQDLMIAANQPTGKQLSFSMSHCMALVVLDLPRKMYTFTNAPTTIPPYIIDAPGTQFNSFIPYRMGDGTYRYLVKPTAAAKTLLSGSYTNAGNEVAEWTIDAKAIAAGTYKVFTVDRIGIEEFSHDLQIGDFYMKDGSLVGKGESLSLEQQKACIGIVYCTDINRIGDAAKKVLKDKGVAAPHGLVMALTEAYGRCRWGDIVDENGDGGTGTFQNNTTTLKKQYNNVDGYAETHWILDTYRNGDALEKIYSAFYHASRYGTVGSGTAKYTAPNTTTGWFIPSMGQWWDILSNLGEIDLKNYQGSEEFEINEPELGQTAVDNMNKYIEEISGATRFSTGTAMYYWSSSEYSSDFACCVGFSTGYYLQLQNLDKDLSFVGRVRCVFAF